MDTCAPRRAAPRRLLPGSAPPLPKPHPAPGRLRPPRHPTLREGDSAKGTPLLQIGPARGPLCQAASCYPAARPRRPLEAWATKEASGRVSTEAPAAATRAHAPAVPVRPAVWAARLSSLVFVFAVAGFFFASGAARVVFQGAWVRILSLIFGVT